MKPDEEAKKAQGLKRLTDYIQVGGAQLEGERIEFKEILGSDIELTDFVFIPSTKYVVEGETSEFVIIQFKLNGKLCTSSTGGKVVVDALKQCPKHYLPMIIKIIKVKGKNYYSIE